MSRFLLLATAMSLGVFVSPAAQANLLVNGGFEIPAVDYELILAGAEPVGFGWTVTEGDVEVQSNAFFGGGFAAYEGSRVLDPLGVSSVGAIFQSFATVPGTQYTLSFAHANRGDTTSLDVDVLGGLTLLVDESVERPGDVNEATWQQSSYTFVAMGTSASLRLMDTSIGTNGNGMLLDAVNVSEVPEPMSIGLLASGVLGLSFARRRKAV